MGYEKTVERFMKRPWSTDMGYGKTVGRFMERPWSTDIGYEKTGWSTYEKTLGRPLLEVDCI